MIFSLLLKVLISDFIFERDRIASQEKERADKFAVQEMS